MIKKLLCISIIVTGNVFAGAASYTPEPADRVSASKSIFWQNYADKQICKRVAQACINIHRTKTLYDEQANSVVVTATPLHYKIASNRMQQAQCLVELGADLNMFDYGGLTPIHLAVYLGPRNVHEVVSFLCATQKIRNDISIMEDIKDRLGRSAIEFLWQLKARVEHRLQKLNKELLPITYQNHHNYVCAINNFATILHAQLQLLYFKQEVTYDKVSGPSDRHYVQQLTCSK